MTRINSKQISFLLLILASILITLVLFFIAAGACGVGHGNCRLFVVFFPLMIVSDIFHTKPSILIALIQFPIYAAILGIAGRKGQMKTIGLILLALHVLAVVIIFAVFG